MAKRTRNSRAKSGSEKGVTYNPRKSVMLDGGKTEAEIRKGYAALVTSPELAGYRVIHIAEQGVGIGTQIDVPALMEQLRNEAAAVNGGDLKQGEAMLINQATALQSLFATLTERSIGSETLAAFEVYMRMALRAQSQCRTTLETLAMIKNPPIVYARQANIAHGNQQVNNGSANQVLTPNENASHHSANIHEGIPQLACGKIKNQQNELIMEVRHGKTVDNGRACEAIGTDPKMATMESIHRT